MTRNIARCVIEVLFDWLSESYIIVKWLNSLSSCYLVKSGVRQGGVLSPVLFSIYVNDILVELNNCSVGCIVKGLVVNVFMYADDLIILSASLTDLQRLINVCVAELNALQLSVNTSKCFCMRVGKRFTYCNSQVVIDSIPIKWTSEIRYLGLYLKAGLVFKINYDYCKKKFYRCLNCILSKTGTKCADIVLSLCQSYCVPILLYGVGAFLNSV